MTKKTVKNNDTLKKHIFMPVGSTVTIQRKEGRSWSYGTITENSDTNQTGRPYRI